MKFIITLLIIFFVLRLILKPLLRLVIQSVVSKMAQQQGGFQKSYTFTNQKRKPEGSIDVDYVPPKDGKGKPSTDGEYVDYEEVK